jgi:hypothetical protein
MPSIYDQIVVYTEAEGRREPTQHGVMPWLAGGQRWRGYDLYCNGRAVPPAMWQVAAQLQAFGNRCLWCSSYIIECTQNTDKAPKSRQEG